MLPKVFGVSSGDHTVANRLKGLLVILLCALVLFCVSGCKPFRYGQGPFLRLDKVHDAGTTCLAFDGIGRRLASAGYRGEVIVWAIPSGKRLTTLKAHRKPVRGLCWIDNALLLSGAEDGRILLWDVAGEQPRGFTNTPAPVTSLIFLPRERLVVSGHTDGWIRSFTLSRLRPAAEFPVGAPVLSLAVDAQSKRIAVSTENGRVILLSPMLQLIKELETSSRNAFEIRFSPDGTQLAGGAWYRLLFWDLHSGLLRMQDTEHWGKIASVDYSPDGKRLASIGRITDNNIRVLDLKTGAVECRLEPHALCGAVVRFSPDGRFLATGSDDESVRLYDLPRS